MGTEERAGDRLGRFGVWRHAGAVSPELARTLERLGYGTVWLGGSPAADLRIVDDLLDATTTLTVATGIVNVWDSDAHEVARSYARIQGRFPGRFLLGVGVGHREATAEYRSPFETLAGYVDTLLADGVPADDLVLAALGPRVLRLAAERTAGAHPYLVTAEHTRSARELIGPGVLLAPEQKVVLEADPERARAIGRPPVARPYLGLSNYTSNLRRLGWTDADLADDGSDALIDALVAHGTADQVAAQLGEHWRAGADHVAVQLLTGPDADLTAQYAELAAALR